MHQEDDYITMDTILINPISARYISKLNRVHITLKANMYSLTVLVVIATFVQGIHSHGRLLNPAGRATAWRKGFGTPVNYNDDELYCGGLTVGGSNFFTVRGE